MEETQRADMARVFQGVSGSGLLDYVSAWYRKAADYMAANPAITTGFVSTNSITQGEQVGVLWPDLLARGVKIHFAHRTFQWSSEARGKAAVHCVIIGFALHDTDRKRLFDYEDIQGEPHEVRAANINPYLVDAPDIIIFRRSKPISLVPPMQFGNQPIDGGFLLLTPAERSAFIDELPELCSFIRPFIGADELAVSRTKCNTG